MTSYTFAEAAIKLFGQYRDAFGLGDSLDRQCEFEDKFVALICQLQGHEIGPDQCSKPEHDLCYRCQRLRIDIEKERV